MQEQELLDVNVADPAPTDAEARRGYVSRVASFHTEVLKPKLQQMVSQALHVLKDPGNDERTDLSLKGTVYALEEIIRWGDSCVNEVIANQNEN